MARKRFTYAEFCADLAMFGLEPDAAASVTVAALKGRYNSRVKLVHPDMPGGSTAKAAELNAANDRLKDWIKRGRLAWPEQGSEPPKPDPAAEAARAAKAAAAEAERRRAEREAAERRAAEAEAARKAMADAEAARKAAAERKAETERLAAIRKAAEDAAALAAAKARHREAMAEAARIAAEAAIAARRAARRERLLWPLRVGRRIGRKVPKRKLAAVAAGIAGIYAWPAVEQSQLATSLPPMPNVGLPLRVTWVKSDQVKYDYPVPRDPVFRKYVPNLDQPAPITNGRAASSRGNAGEKNSH